MKKEEKEGLAQLLRDVIDCSNEERYDCETPRNTFNSILRRMIAKLEDPDE